MTHVDIEIWSLRTKLHWRSKVTWFIGSDWLIAPGAYFPSLLDSQLDNVFQPTSQWKCNSILAHEMWKEVICSLQDLSIKTTCVILCSLASFVCQLDVDTQGNLESHPLNMEKMAGVWASDDYLYPLPNCTPPNDSYVSKINSTCEPIKSCRNCPLA